MDKIEKYARHLAKQYPVYAQQQYTGKNGADSDNEKGYWRGMADSVLAVLNDLKHAGLIAHTGLYDDEWPTGKYTGKLADLPVGTRFRVINGDWYGTIKEKDSIKYIETDQLTKVIIRPDDNELQVEVISPGTKQ